MDTIREPELIDYFQNNAVKKLTIQRSANNRYRITVRLKWKPTDVRLLAQKGHDREWVSLDRLIKHIDTKYGIAPAIQLLLDTPNTQKEKASKA
jgi:hypothetical protein